MRLKDDAHRSRADPLRRVHCGGDLARVMGVIADDRRAVQRADFFKTPLYAAETLQSAFDFLGRESCKPRRRIRRERVVYLHLTVYPQADPHGRRPLLRHRERVAFPLSEQVFRSDVSRIQPEGKRAGNAPRTRVVRIDDRHIRAFGKHTVRRQQIVVIAVAVRVIEIGIEHDGDLAFQP